MIAEAMETVFTDTDAISRISDQIRQQDKTLWEKIADFLKGLVEKLRKAYKGVDPDSRTAQEMRPILSTSEKILDAYVNAAVSAIEQYNTLSPTNDATAFDADGGSNSNVEAKTAQKNNTPGGVMKSIRNIIGESGTDYGTGVYLDSNILDNLSGTAREARAKGFIRSIGGMPFTAYDRNGVKHDIVVAPSTKFKNEKGKKVPANQHLTDYLRSEIKQDAIVLVDELILTSNFDGTSAASHSHGWLDNNGKNDWETWTTFIQEKNNSVWKATLHVSNSEDGRKILYEVHPIEKVEAAGKPSTSSTETIVSPDAFGVNKNSMKSSRYSDYSKMSYAEIENEQRILAQQEMSLRDRKRNAETNSELVDAMNAYSDLFSEMRKLLPKKRNGTATQSDLDRIDEIKSIRDEYINKIADIQERIGLNAIYEEEAALREKKEELRKAADAAWEREGAEKENKEIEKSGLSPEEYFRGKALKAFKTTSNFNEAGYLLPDGKMLNFSGGERNHRYRDHREIGEIYEATNGVAALNRFLNDGNIRIMAESPGIDISSSVEPTGKQYEVIRKFVNSHGLNEQKFFVDFSGADGGRAGNYAYEGRVSAERVINDIKYYYENGTTREQSYLSAFYSSRNAEQKNNTPDGVMYSLRNVEIPTRSELDAKDPVKIVDISTKMTSGTFSERRKEFKELIPDIISKPYLNRDTNTLIFLTNASYTHSYSNFGEKKMNALEHLPDLIENAVLTNSDHATHGSEYADKVYTFFAAVQTDKVYPVRLKVKEYRYSGQQLPENIASYFKRNPSEYSALYDAMVLELDEIEGDLSGSAKALTEKTASIQSPDRSPTISVADLLNLVNREYQKYIPQHNDIKSRKSSRNRMSEETKAAIDAYRAQQDALSKAQKALYEQERKEIVKAYKDKLKNLERSYSEEVADIQKAFFSLVRSYEAKTDEAGASGQMVEELTEALKQEVKAHDIDRELWEQEFSRLSREYERLKGSSADKVKALEEKVQHQREAAHAKVESARKTEMRHKIQNTVNTLNRYLLNPTKDIHVPDSITILIPAYSN